MDRHTTPPATNDLLGLYSHLQGSHGQVCVRLPRKFLENLCALLESQFKDEIEEILVSPSGDSRFRVRAKLPSTFATWLGSGFLNILGEEGIEIAIEQPSASHKKPFQGSLVTTLLGKTIIPQLVKSINQGLGAGRVLKMSSEVLRTTTYITLDPFPLLQKFLPGSLGHHVTQVQ